MNLSSVLRCPYCHKEDLGNIDLVSGIYPYIERMCKMVELKINTKYRVMGLPENVGRIENGDIVETTDIVQNLPFVGVVGITHPESAWIKKTFLKEL